LAVLTSFFLIEF